MNIRVHNIDPVFILEGGIGSFPCCNPPATGTECNGRGFYPEGAKTVEEVCLTSYFAVFYVGISKFAYIHLFSS
jgi:hypothetical protein